MLEAIALITWGNAAVLRSELIAVLIWLRSNQVSYTVAIPHVG
jgi:hypothetical protein